MLDFVRETASSSVYHQALIKWTLLGEGRFVSDF